MSIEPLVTCICLSLKERRDTFLPRAVECFDKQTYQNRELLIVTEPLKASLFATLRVSIGSNFRTRIIPHSSPATIGTLRNFACQYAQGEIIAVWDDDDYSAPKRLAYQVEVLRERKAAVTGFCSMKFTDGFGNWWRFRYPNPHKLVLGTSLCFRKEWWEKHPFDPEYNVGEDVRFSDEAATAGELVSCGDVEMMYATLHLGNTSKKRPEGEGWVALPGGLTWASFIVGLRM